MWKHDDDDDIIGYVFLLMYRPATKTQVEKESLNDNQVPC